jgi:hypothetical protein
MAGLVSHEPVTLETWVQFQDNACGICDGQHGTGTGFFSEYFGFPLSLSFHLCIILIHSSVTDAI